MCEVICHEGQCPPCPLSQQRHCPCGKNTYQVISFQPSASFISKNQKESSLEPNEFGSHILQFVQILDEQILEGDIHLIENIRFDSLCFHRKSWAFYCSHSLD